MERPFIESVERLSEVVVTARLEQGLSRGQLAEGAGVTTAFVADLEDGVARAEHADTLRVLRVLGMDPRALPTYGIWMYGNDGRLKNADG
ncbi:MAG TPA: hypothetical protein PKE40_16580 [Arachnia sp.]|nr:hypothetical protein [Arachnia sp.]